MKSALMMFALRLYLPLMATLLSVLLTYALGNPNRYALFNFVFQRKIRSHSANPDSLELPDSGTSRNPSVDATKCFRKESPNRDYITILNCFPSNFFDAYPTRFPVVIADL